jgi:anthranilate synthase/aminodeoxychorismate synthase-like glutamine amidotransferase
MKILLIDNYDSFTFNLVQLIGKNKVQIEIIRNDEISVNDVKLVKPTKIVISPGPGRPEYSRLSLEVIKEFGEKIPILGVCLGMQAICQTFGAEIINSRQIYHGKTSPIKHNGKGIFAEIPQEFEAMRYHSLIVKRNTLPKEIEVTATAEHGIVMGIKHKKYPMDGIQFHPESILTLAGKQIINNWIEQDTFNRV